MFNLFQNIHIDWLGKRKVFIAFSIFIMLMGLISTIGRQYTPGGTDAFNLGVDFKGGTVVVAKFKGERPSDDAIRAALNNAQVRDPQIQASTDKPDEVLIKIPLVENAAAAPGPDSVPGAPALLAFSGTVTEMMANGPVPVEDAYVEVCGYDAARTDERGFYSLTVPANTSLFVQKAGYKAQLVTLNLSPEGRLDVRLERE